MARLICNDGFEIEIKLKLGIQSPDIGIIITLWKDEKPYLVPEIESDYCDSVDYDNYRLMDYQYAGSDEFLPFLQSYSKAIQLDDLAHEGAFQCWPEYRICIFLQNNHKSDIVNVKIEYGNDVFDEVKFKNLEDTLDGTFKFNTTKDNIISFVKLLEKEFSEEKKPKRVLLKKIDSEDEPWEEEKKIIKKQKYIKSNKPIIIIDSGLLLYNNRSEDVIAFNNCIIELQKEYKVAIIGIKKKELKKKEYRVFFDKLDDLIYLKDRCYPKNKEIVYLRNSIPRFSMLSIYCCLDRAVTSIWFDYFCNSDWSRACEVIKEYAENQIALTDLSNDEGTCGYVI